MDDDQTLRSMVRDDAYRIVRVLGDGPSGRTELVTFGGEGLLVRKHIPIQLANAPAWAAAMDLNEPLLPHIEELYRMPDELVVVYDYVEGDALSTVVECEGRLEARRAVAVLADVCQAVSALHGRDVVHRDITPSNVILAADGAHLVDLGIARQRQEGRRRDTNTLGTWGFAAPEQYGFAQTDARSDVYSLGRLLGYALTGEKPDAEAYEIILCNKRQVPEALCAVVQRATAFEPSARYQSADELAQAAWDALAGRPAPTDETGPAGAGASASAHASAPASAKGPRAFTDAPYYVRFLAILAWIALALSFAVVLMTGIDTFVTHNSVWGPPQYAMGVVIDAGIVLLGFEVNKAVRLLDGYAKERHPAGLFITRVCIYLILIFIIMMSIGIAISYATEPV